MARLPRLPLYYVVTVLYFAASSHFVSARPLLNAKAEVNTVLNILGKKGFSQFAHFVHLVGPNVLSSYLQRTGAVTLMAASNAAVLQFSNHPPVRITRPSQLLRILSYNIIGGRHLWNEIASSRPGRLLATADGSHMVVLGVSRGVVTLATPGDGNGAHHGHITVRSIYSNAFVNVLGVDRLLMPPSLG